MALRESQFKCTDWHEGLLLTSVLRVSVVQTLHQREDVQMKLGMLTAMFGDKPLKEVLQTIKPLGLDTVELGTGNYPGDPHAPLGELSDSKPKRDELLAMLKGEGLEISALSCHGNCIHPNKDFAKKNADI